MVTEDFSAFTGVDPNSHISITSSRVTVSGLMKNETAYVYKSYGSGHFNGDFEHLLTIRLTSAETYTYWVPWALWETKQADSNADHMNNRNASHSGLGIVIKRAGDASRTMHLEEYRGGSTVATSQITLSEGTTYYLKIVKNETVGTLKLHIYTDADRTNEISGSPLSINLQTPYVDYEFLYAAASHSTGAATSGISGYCEDLDLQEPTYTISGVTRDANGNPLGGCTVWLFRSSDKAFIEATTSDGNGIYSFAVGDQTTEYFIRAHKDGTPNVFGTTDDNLTGS